VAGRRIVQESLPVKEPTRTAFGASLVAQRPSRVGYAVMIAMGSLLQTTLARMRSSRVAAWRVEVVEGGGSAAAELPFRDSHVPSPCSPLPQRVSGSAGQQ